MNSDTKYYFSIGSLFAFFSVAAGAFGAHGLRGQVSADLLNAFEVGVRYHLIHALALMILGLVMDRFKSALFQTGANFLVVGTLIFSGSLYTLVLSNQKFWGMVTPIGGLLLLVGWIIIVTATLKSDSD